MSSLSRTDPQTPTSRPAVLPDAIAPTTTMAILPENVGPPGSANHSNVGDAEGLKPAGSLTSRQQQRLVELLSRWWQARDSGNTLPPEEQDELEALARVELRGPGGESVW